MLPNRKSEPVENTATPRPTQDSLLREFYGDLHGLGKIGVDNKTFIAQAGSAALRLSKGLEDIGLKSQNVAGLTGVMQNIVHAGQLDGTPLKVAVDELFGLSTKKLFPEYGKMLPRQQAAFTELSGQIKIIELGPHINGIMANNNFDSSHKLQQIKALPGDMFLAGMPTPGRVEGYMVYVLGRKSDPRELIAVAVNTQQKTFIVLTTDRPKFAVICGDAISVVQQGQVKGAEISIALQDPGKMLEFLVRAEKAARGAGIEIASILPGGDAHDQAVRKKQQLDADSTIKDKPPTACHVCSSGGKCAASQAVPNDTLIKLGARR